MADQDPREKGLFESTELVRREQQVSVMPPLSGGELEQYWRVAQALAKSRMFKDAYQAEQALAKILVGRDLGISPTRALMSIDLVEGSIQLRGVLLAGFIRQHPGYEYRVLENDDKHAKVQFLGFPAAEPYDESMVRHRGRFWEVLGVESFSVEDAKKAGTVKQKSAWEKYPKNMCVWRALSNGVKFHMPELMGGMPVYVEGELPPAQTTIGPTGRASAEPQPLPEEIAQLLPRVHAVDSTAWRPNEIRAMLPDRGDEKYVPAVDGVVANIKRWLDEHEPQDAEVVPEGEPEGGPGVSVGTSAAEALESDQQGGLEPHATVERRYRADPEFREQVDVLLNRRTTLEEAVDDPQAAAEIGDELEAVDKQLAELGFPTGWLPVSEGQTSLGVE